MYSYSLLDKKVVEYLVFYIKGIIFVAKKMEEGRYVPPFCCNT